MVEALASLVGQVQKSGIQVASSVNQIAATAKQQQATAAEVAATTLQIGATSREISATSRELVKTVADVSKIAEGSAALSLLRSGDRIADTYEVRRVLSRSSSTVVYLGRHLTWEIDVALRVPVPDGLEKVPPPRKLVELASQWTALGLHPHIAYCHYVHAVDGVPVVVIEPVEGSNLRGWIAGLPAIAIFTVPPIA